MATLLILGGLFALLVLMALAPGLWHPRRRRSLLPSTLALAAVLVIAGCGSSAKKESTTARYAGAVASPAKPAPPIALRNYNGKPVELSQFRGKATLVTFLYTHCPDVCPLIVGNLRVAQAKLGPEAKRMQIVAVSVDPKGDTPKTVSAFLKARDMTGRMDYLIGSAPELRRVWKAWQVGVRVPKGNPDKVEHAAPIFGISASGKVTTLYASNFKPAMIAHDVPILASS